MSRLSCHQKLLANELKLQDNRPRIRVIRTTGSSFLKDAALGIVVCGDETKSDVWVEDCSIASIVVQLTAQALGFGSCWIQIRKRPHSQDRTAEEYIQETLGIPQHLKVESIISIGYPAESKKPILLEKLEFEKIRYNKY